MVTCPICGGVSPRLFMSHDYWIRDCRICPHRFAEIAPVANHVETTYDDHYFFGGGAGYQNYLVESQLLIEQGRRYGRLVAKHAGPGSVLDVGAAAGFLLEGYRQSGWRGAGIEPNPRLAEWARTNFTLPVTNGTLEDFRSEERFDLISIIQVVAHFVDPLKALRAADAVTRPGGFWLIETWNFVSWTSRLFGRNWHEYSPPSVLHWFCPQGLQRLAGEFGFREIARGRPAKWISGEHAKSLLTYKLGSGLARGLAARVIPNRLSIPYPAEDLFWSLFQKR